MITRIYFLPLILVTVIGPHKSIRSSLSLDSVLGTNFGRSEAFLLLPFKDCQSYTSSIRYQQSKGRAESPASHDTNADERVDNPEKAHEALAGPDPEPMKEDQTGSDSGKLHVSLAGPNPEHMDDEFLATAYPKVHENLKLITDERVIDDKPESHSGSMSSMKDLDDTFNFGDQFLHDKLTEEDQEKSKVREESDSTIPDPNQ
ncbi:hypothetical protein Tco_0241113 [Tanacetum coccineum]